MGFLLRWIFAFALVAGTYNPSGWSYATWVRDHYKDELPMTVLLGLILLIGYIIYMRATLRSIGGLGMFLVCAVFAALIWVLYDLGVLSLDNTTYNSWMGILALSFVLGIGLSWSFVRRAISGQQDVDDMDE